MAQTLEQSTGLPSSLQLLSSLKYLISYALFTSVGNGLWLPESAYIMINWFAQSYTDLPPHKISCEYNIQADYCKQAVLDCNRMNMVIGIVCPAIQFFLMPVVGVLSDAYGRWRVMLVFHVVALLCPLTAFLVKVKNISIAWYIVTMVTTINPITSLSWGTVVHMAMVTDLVQCPAARSAGLGMLEAAMAAATLLGSSMGPLFAGPVAMSIALGLYASGLVYLLLVVPESLPPEKRQRKFSWSTLLPGVELSILGRNSSLKLLSVILCITGAVDAGYNRVLPSLMQYEMNWTVQDTYISTVLQSASVLIALGLLFRPLAERLGDVGMLALGRAIGTLSGVVASIASSPWQFLVMSFFSSGPAGFALPAVAGLKSTMVGAGDQGAMQGALNTIFNVSSSIGVFLFGFIFDVSNRQNIRNPEMTGHVNKLCLYIGISIGVPVLMLISRIPAALKSDGISDGKGGLLETAPDLKPLQKGSDGMTDESYGAAA